MEDGFTRDGPTDGHLIRAAAGFTLLYLVIFGRIVVSGRLLATGDGLINALPAFHAPMSLWSPTVFSGFPVAADPQNMFWNPLSLLLPNGLVWFSLFVALGYVIAAFGEYVFIWTVTRSRMGAAVAGLVYGLSGFFAAHIGHVNMIQVAAWAPLLLAGIERMRRGRGRGGATLTALSAAMCILGGHPQLTVKALLLGGLYACVRAAGAPGGWLRFLARAFRAVAVGTGMAAVLLVPLIQLAGLSLREGFDFSFFVQGSVPPRQLVTLVFPVLLGGWHTPLNHVAYFGKWYVSDVTGFVGLTAMLLALVALTAGPTRRLGRFWAVVAVVALVLMLGRYTPLAHVLYHVPILNQFRSPARYLFEFTTAVAALAGLGLAALQRTGNRERLKLLRRALAGTGLVIAGALVVTAFSAPVFRSWAAAKLHTAAAVPWRLEAVVPPLLFFGLSFLALWMWARRPGSRLRSVAVVAAVGIELLHFGWIYPRDAFTRVSTLSAARHRLAPLMNELKTEHARYAPLEGNHQGVEAGMPNLSLLWGFPSASGSNPLLLRDYAHVASMKRWGGMADAVTSPDDCALDLLSVRFLLIPSRRRSLIESLTVAGGGAAEPPARWIVQKRFGKTAVLRNRRVLPRVWAVREVVPLGMRETVRAIHTSRLPGGAVFDPRTTALVEDGPRAEPRRRLAAATVHVVAIEPDHIRVRSSSPGPAFLVLSDVDYPGWEARVDGHPVPVTRTDAILRGVAVPAGRHDIHFDFHPRAFQAGAGISIVSLLLFLVLGWIELRGTPQQPRRAVSGRDIV